MPGSRHNSALVLGITTIVVLLVIAVIWLFLLLQNPALLTEGRNLIGTIIQVLSLLGLGALLKKRFKSFVRPARSLSTSLAMLVGREWIVQVFSWLLVLFTLVHIGYTMPVHRVVVAFEQPPACRLPEAVLLKIGRVQFELKPDSVDSSRYQSDRMLRWGDSAGIIMVTAGRDSIYKTVAWPGLAFLNVFGNIEITECLTMPTVLLDIRPLPDNAQIQITQPLDTAFIGPGTCRVPRGETIRIAVTAPDHLETLVYVPGLQKDTTIEITLEQEPGYVTFKTYKPDGSEFRNLRIHINGELTGYKSWNRITLKPGIYHIYIDSVEPPADTFYVLDFQTTVRPNRHAVDSLDVLLK